MALSMSDWVWEIDAEGRYTYCSDQILDLLGYTAEEMLGKTPFDVMTAEEAARVRKIFAKIADNKEPIRDLENRIVTKDGCEIILLTNGVPSLDKEGNLLGYRGVDKDITQRKQTDQQIQDYAAVLENKNLALKELNEAVEAANRSKSEFLANMSHEIRTPMTAILGFTDVLLGNLEEKENVSAANTIKRNGKYLLELIKLL